MTTFMIKKQVKFDFLNQIHESNWLHCKKNFM